MTLLTEFPIPEMHLDYVAEYWKPTGIITTKSHIVKMANELGLKTIQRIFLIDRAAIKKGIEMVKSCQPDAVEILPGIIPKVIDQAFKGT